MRKILPAAVLAAAALSTATACSSSSSTAHAASSSAATRTATGSPAATHAATTETMTGQLTGAAAVAGKNGPTVPLTLTGPVATTSSFTPPGGNSTHATVTFRTPAGNLVVNADAPDANATPAANLTTCWFHQDVHATYVVDGAKSTGKFGGATGSGKVLFTFAAYGPKLANGKCNTADSAQPLAKGALVTFSATGPLSLKP